MHRNLSFSALLLGLCGLLGLASLGYLLGDAAIDFKLHDRSVTVKGLSEREYPADIVIWPIGFTTASNDLESLYDNLEDKTHQVMHFLEKSGVRTDEISSSTPTIHDKLAQQYTDTRTVEFRFTASRTVTVYSTRVDTIRALMTRLPQLGKQGIVLTGGNYANPTEYLFTRLNDVKPAMIEETTLKARQVAQKFAQDSQSVLGKIRRATQGQFSISGRDSNNPHIKRVRVVSTVEYYLTD